MHACGVDEWHLAHTYDAHFWTVVHLCHDLFKLVGYAEEVRAVDLVYLYVLWYLKLLNVGVGGKVCLCCWVNDIIVGKDADLCCLSHAAHAEETGYHEANLDGYGEVEDNGEDEGEPEDEGVALGVVHHLSYCAPSAHVVADYDEDTCETCHWDILGVWHKEEVDEEEHYGMDDACDRCLAAVVDIGHGAGNGACGWYASEDGAEHVGYSLSDELLVGVVLVTNDTVRHSGREEALYGSEDGDGDGW